MQTEQEEKTHQTKGAQKERREGGTAATNIPLLAQHTRVVAW